VYNKVAYEIRNGYHRETARNGWAAAIRYGCDSSYNMFRRGGRDSVEWCEKNNKNGQYKCEEIRVCGCSEIWCPVKEFLLTNPKDKRHKCFTVSKPFGCFKNGKYDADCLGEVNYRDHGRSEYEKHVGPFWQLMNF